jgi:hypothetical protein
VDSFDDNLDGSQSTEVTFDLESVLTSELYQRLVEADVEEALRELELPHVVVCFDPQTASLTVEGPFDEGLSALRMAEDDAIADRMHGTGFTYLVLPLLPRRDRE